MTKKHGQDPQWGLQTFSGKGLLGRSQLPLWKVLRAPTSSQILSLQQQLQLFPYDLLSCLKSYPRWPQQNIRNLSTMDRKPIKLPLLYLAWLYNLSFKTEESMEVLISLGQLARTGTTSGKPRSLGSLFNPLNKRLRQRMMLENRLLVEIANELVQIPSALHVSHSMFHSRVFWINNGTACLNDLHPEDLVAKNIV